MNQLDFKGRTAVVTGGLQGIGAAIVKRLQDSGAKVAVWDLDGSPKVDVSDASSIDSALRSTFWSITPASPARTCPPSTIRSRNGSACCAST
jgi:NAD(P)-dependent dehydrogenase (short-subunit alcohol dehydrogenase family)